MKNHRLLLLIPVFALTACQSQSEVTAEKAKEIIQDIQDNKNIGPFIFALSNKGSIGKGEEKISVDLIYKLRSTSEGYYTYIKGNSGDTKFDAEFYCVSGTRHGDVKCVRYFDEAKNDYAVSVATSKYNDDYEEAFKELGVYRTSSLYEYYSQATPFFSELEEGDTLKCYSSKDGQLTFETRANLKTVDPNAEEKVKSGKETYKYENYRFISVNGSTTSTYGNKWATQGTAKYDSNIKVELPSDWESYLTFLS